MMHQNPRTRPAKRQQTREGGEDVEEHEVEGEGEEVEEGAVEGDSEANPSSIGMLQLSSGLSMK